MFFTFASTNNGWGVRAAAEHPEENTARMTGREVLVTKRNGERTGVKLGAALRSFDGGRATLYAIARDDRETEREDARRNRTQGQPAEEAAMIERIAGNAPAEAVVTEPGVYELPTGEIFIVKPNRQRTRMYAKQLREINAERATEAGTRVEIEFDYAPGAIYRLRPEHKMCVKRAKELTIRYRRCIVCGIRLRAAESVERGIGPVCIQSFRGYRAPARRRRAAPRAKEVMAA
jgi:hypothetical protein